MSVESMLARGRSLAERLMTDRCTIQRKTGETTDDDGTITPVYASVYTGKCRVQQPGGQAAQTDAGENYQLLLRLEVQVPVSVVDLEPGDRVTITASSDPDLPGTVFLIRDLAHKTHATARRLGVTELTS